MATTGSSSSAATPDRAPAAPDIVVGVPADGRVGADPGALVRAVAASLERRLEPGRWRIVLAHAARTPAASAVDAAASNGHLREVQYTPQPGDALNVPFHGLSGRARAIEAILRDAHAQQARGCLLLDPRGAGAEGPFELMAPILDGGADFVAPVYQRHPIAGALVHAIVYPLFRALYGARLRYPMGPDFACSSALIEAVLDEPVWGTEGSQIGIDLWMSATALTGGFRVAQAAAGPGRQEPPAVDLGTTLSQIVGYLFSDMERRAAAWQRVRGSRPVAQGGHLQPVPEAPAVDPAALVESFRLASRELQDVWAEVLPPLAMLQWRRLAGVPVEAFHVDPALWARTIYDFAMGHRLRVIARDHLLRSLTPLYLAWLASFIGEVRHVPPEEAEARIERQCAVFESEKPYLVSQWRWPERFKPVKLRR